MPYDVKHMYVINNIQVANNYIRYSNKNDVPCHRMDVKFKLLFEQFFLDMCNKATITISK